MCEDIIERYAEHFRVGIGELVEDIVIFTFNNTAEESELRSRMFAAFASQICSMQPFLDSDSSFGELAYLDASFLKGILIIIREGISSMPCLWSQCSLHSGTNASG